MAKQDTRNLGLIKVETFNGCYGEEIRDTVAGNQFIVPVDTEMEYWANCEDTLVISLTATKRTDIVLAMMALSNLNADEFDVRSSVFTADDVIIRLWWD